MKLLIIEDDTGITAILRTALGKLYSVDIAPTGSAGIQKATANTYAAVVLDLNLPDINGLEVCKLLRNQGFSAPILVLSGETKIMNKVHLLDAGADDYLTKPFSIEELKARLRVLLRRRETPAAPAHKISIGQLTLDPSQRIVERDGRLISLRRKEFSLLECLMLHADSVVTREMLAQHAWKEESDIWTNTVDVHIKHLRDKVDRPFGPPLIKTVHGLGYKLDSTVLVAQK
jgi:DNA-binding response OmpR family regulator